MPNVTPDACPWCHQVAGEKYHRSNYLGSSGNFKSDDAHEIMCKNIFCPVKPKTGKRKSLAEAVKYWNAAIAENRARGVFPTLNPPGLEPTRENGFVPLTQLLPGDKFFHNKYHGAMISQFQNNDVKSDKAWASCFTLDGNPFNLFVDEMVYPLPTRQQRGIEKYSKGENKG